MTEFGIDDSGPADPSISNGIAGRALLLAQRAIEEMIAYLESTGVSADDVIAATHVLFSQGADDDSGDTSGHRQVAAHLSLAASSMVHVDEPDATADDHADPDQGYLLIMNGDYDGARAVADAVLLDADRTAASHWNHGNLVHHGHILRGRVFLLNGDIAAATVELLQAAETNGSPQLNSFGPDLWLAGALLRAGQIDAVTAYLQRVAAFWNP